MSLAQVVAVQTEVHESWEVAFNYMDDQVGQGGGGGGAEGWKWRFGSHHTLIKKIVRLNIKN